MSRKLLSVLSLLLATIGIAQDHVHSERCKAHTITERLLEQQGSSANIKDALPRMEGGDRGNVLTVPVVVHVVWNTSSENVPDAAILAMINQMNLDYAQNNSDISGVRAPFVSSIADVGIQFCMAQTDPQGNATNGITRTQTTATWFDPDNQTNAMKSPPLGKSPWNPSQYLNIWVCDISSGAVGGLVTLGYAYLPVGGVVGSNIDGLVVDYLYGLPSTARTATHEIGHYFGLEHPWADGGCSSDDGFSDTPNTDTPTFSCANTNLQKCGTLTQYENFMDYSNCPVMFTAQQRTYMRGILTGVRSSLLNSTACGTILEPGVCIPTSAYGPASGDFINGVTFGTINNVNSGGTSMPTYSDYTGTWSTTVAQGSTNTITIQGGTYFPNNFAVWIDLDQNNVFQASEKMGEFSTSSSGQTQSITFNIPANAMIGTTRSRVRGVYHDTNEPSPTDPCFNYGFGETEDYAITITSGASGVCIPGSSQGTVDGDFINGVTLGNINNINTGSTQGQSYNDFTALSTVLDRGVSYSLVIQGGAYHTDHFAAWIDHNGDQNFAANEKLGEFTISAPYQTQTINFTVPNNAQLGPVRMRVRGVYHLDDEPSPTDPCFAYAYGETEDYTVVIDNSSGLNSLNEGQMLVYPNPAGDQVTVQLIGGAPATISICDALGREVATHRTNGLVTELPLHGLSSGQYFLKVQQEMHVELVRLQVLRDN